MIKIGRNEPCWCGSNKKYKQCHEAFDEKLRRMERQGYIIPSHDQIKTLDEVENIKEGAKINIAVLDYVAENNHAGMTTEEIDKLVYEKTTEMGGIPAPLNYEGFPKSVCTSLNNEVCHGIPSDQIILTDGDIINVDCSTILDGYYSDSSRMFCIGQVSEEAKRLVEVTKQAVEEGVRNVIPWNTLGDMGAAVHKIATDHGYTVVREIGGHGVGIDFHEDPFVSYCTKPGTGMVMAPGLMFTIEPMINQFGDEIYQDAENGWTIYTEDDGLSAQWEVQVLVTETGCEIISY